MASAIEAGIPKLRIEESATKTQARIDSKSQTVVGVNKYLSSEKDNIPILKVDNKKVREGQLKRLEQLKADRDMKTTQESLDALTKSAETGEGNLLELAINAARAKATVGEISYALEKVWGRYEASPTGVQNIYSNAFDPSCESLNQAKVRVKVFKELEGRSPRILIAKMGQDGHDRGQKSCSNSFSRYRFRM